MFKFFKKVSNEAHLVDEKEIMDRIREGTAKGHHSAFFFNAELTDSAKKKLEEQHISIRTGDSNGSKFFEIFWKV